jgi:hypothetical protein
MDSLPPEQAMGSDAGEKGTNLPRLKPSKNTSEELMQKPKIIIKFIYQLRHLHFIYFFVHVWVFLSVVKL